MPVIHRLKYFKKLEHKKIAKNKAGVHGKKREIAAGATQEEFNKKLKKRESLLNVIIQQDIDVLFFSVSSQSSQYIYKHP